MVLLDTSCKLNVVEDVGVRCPTELCVLEDLVGHLTLQQPVDFLQARYRLQLVEVLVRMSYAH
jgi:hypothetical protein